MDGLEKVGQWARDDVLSVGMLTGELSVRMLELEQRVSFFVPEGAARLRVHAAASTGKPYVSTVAPPRVGLVPPCQELEVEKPTSAPLLVLALDPDFVSQRLADSELRLPGPAVANDPYLHGVGGVLRDTFKCGLTPTPHHLRDLAVELREHLYARYVRPPRRQGARPLSPERLERARAFIRSRYGDNALNVAAIAAHVSLSPFHFTRLFTAATGKAPHAYLTQVRIDEAKRLLGATCLPIAEIAQRTGYATHAHFTGMFGRHVGMTPAAWRTSARSERAEARRQAGK